MMRDGAMSGAHLDGATHVGAAFRRGVEGTLPSSPPIWPPPSSSRRSHCGFAPARGPWTGKDDGMADENPSQDLFKQFWSTMERMGMTAGKVPAQMLGMPAVPMPGGLAEAQVAAIVGAIRAQRSGITNMRANLDAYEQQLVVMEQLLEPLEAMTRTWAETEKKITG
jgi:hypothetical protein